MHDLRQLFKHSLVVLSLIYIAILLMSISFGVYFLGDTISHLQFAALGGPLTTFIQHDSLWPPLLALLLNIILKIPFDTYITSSLYVSAILVLYVATSTTFFKIFFNKWSISLVLATLTITGAVGLIMQSLLSEPVFILLWMCSLVFLTQFWISSKEKWLIGWLIAAALLPLTRYLGIPILSWMSLVLISKLFIDYKSTKATKYSFWLVVMCLVTVWIPLAFYLLKTKVIIGSFLPVRDVQVLQTSFEVIVQFFTQIGTDLMVVAPVALLVGAVRSSKRKFNHLAFIIVLLLGTAGMYLVSLLVSEIKYFVLPYLPSRYVGVSYPFIVAGLVGVGAWLRQKYLVDLGTKWVVGSTVLLASLLMFSSYTTVIRLQAEKLNTTAAVDQVLWTGDLEKLCDQTKQKYLVAHIHSRNWLAWSYAYFCNGTVLLQQSASIEKDALVISAYSLDNENLIEQNILNINNYATYFYLSTQSAELDVDQAFSSRGEFE